jgi:hypothetical protein
MTNDPLKSSPPIAALVFALLLVIATAAEPKAETSWQLLLSYDSQSVTVVEAAKIPSMTKQTRTPGLIGAPVKISYGFEWLDDSARILHATTAELPLGVRAVMGDGEPCLEFMPEAGHVLIRIDGPDDKQAPAAIRLIRGTVSGRAKDRLQLPTPFESNRLELPVTRQTKLGTVFEGPVSWEKVRDTGPNRNRLVVVVMGDGYTLANLTNGEFTNHVTGLLGALGQKEPWDVLLEATNIYRIDVESNEEGADHEVYGVFKDTYLNSSFWTYDIQRFLTIDGTGYNRAYNAANSVVGNGVWDYILVLVNSTVYGGSGDGLTVSSVHPSASEIVVHEMGHTLAGLADEYETAYPGYPPGDPEPNVDYSYSGPGLKWIEWVELSTPLPTPESLSYSSVVGAFEGARYFSTGIYRPWYNCLMRTLGVDFGPVCQEAHAQTFMYMVNLADNVSPVPRTSQDINSEGKTFMISPLPISGLVYQWRLDGTPISAATGQELILFPDDMTQPSQTLDVAVTFATDLIRQDSVFETYSWTVSHTPSCCTGSRGNVDCDPPGIVDIGDVSALIRHLFIDLQPVCCPEEANVDGTGIIDVGDLTALLAHLFISLDPSPPCP